MKKIFAFLIAGLLCSTCLAQIKTTTTEKKALLGVTSPVIQGNRILVGADSNVAVSPVVILSVETDYKFKRIKAFRDGTKVEAEPLSETEYLFAGAGKYRVEVTVFDPEKGIDDTEVVFSIGSSPSPQPEPDPEPEPDPQPQPGPFENLAIRVAALSVTLSAEERSRWVSVLEQTVSKMKSYEFRRVDDARNFLRQSKLPNANLNRLLEDDSKTRLLSFNETISYYQEVIRGLK